jgi:hypothetical protein
VLLVGYGAAEVPRALWANANARGELRKAEFQAPEVEATLFDAQTQLQDVCAAIRQAAARVAALESSPAFASGDGAEELAEVKRCLATVQAKAVLEQDAAAGGAGGGGGLVAPLYAGSRGGAGLGGGDDDDEEGGGGGGWGVCGRRRAKLSDSRKLMNALAGLHKRLMAASAKLAKTRFRWDRLVRKVSGGGGRALTHAGRVSTPPRLTPYPVCCYPQPTRPRPTPRPTPNTHPRRRWRSWSTWWIAPCRRGTARAPRSCAGAAPASTGRAARTARAAAAHPWATRATTSTWCRTAC